MSAASARRVVAVPDCQTICGNHKACVLDGAPSSWVSLRHTDGREVVAFIARLKYEFVVTYNYLRARLFEEHPTSAHVVGTLSASSAELHRVESSYEWRDVCAQLGGLRSVDTLSRM